MISLGTSSLSIQRGRFFTSLTATSTRATESSFNAASTPSPGWSRSHSSKGTRRPAATALPRMRAFGIVGRGDHRGAHTGPKVPRHRRAGGARIAADFQHQGRALRQHGAELHVVRRCQHDRPRPAPTLQAWCPPRRNCRLSACRRRKREQPFRLARERTSGRHQDRAWTRLLQMGGHWRGQSEGPRLFFGRDQPRDFRRHGRQRLTGAACASAASGCERANCQGELPCAGGERKQERTSFRPIHVD